MRTWEAGHCRSQIVNTGAAPVALKEVTLFSVAHTLPPTTPLYGEGFQMLSQTGGTLGAIADLGNYTDVKHYRMPEPAGIRVVYNLLTLAARRRPSRAGVHVVPPLQRTVSRVRPTSIDVGAGSGGPIARSRRELAARRVRVSRAAPIARPCSRRSLRVSANTTLP